MKDTYEVLVLYKYVSSPTNDFELRSIEDFKKVPHVRGPYIPQDQSAVSYMPIRVILPKGVEPTREIISHFKENEYMSYLQSHLAYHCLLYFETNKVDWYRAGDWFCNVCKMVSWGKRTVCHNCKNHDGDKPKIFVKKDIALCLSEVKQALSMGLRVFCLSGSYQGMEVLDGKPPKKNTNINNNNKSRKSKQPSISPQENKNQLSNNKKLSPTKSPGVIGSRPSVNINTNANNHHNDEKLPTYQQNFYTSPVVDLISQKSEDDLFPTSDLYNYSPINDKKVRNAFQNHSTIDDHKVNYPNDQFRLLENNSPIHSYQSYSPNLNEAFKTRQSSLGLKLDTQQTPINYDYQSINVSHSLNNNTIPRSYNQFNYSDLNNYYRDYRSLLAYDNFMNAFSNNTFNRRHPYYINDEI